MYKESKEKRQKRRSRIADEAEIWAKYNFSHPKQLDALTLKNVFKHEIRYVNPRNSQLKNPGKSEENVLKNVVEDCLECSSIHGVRYLGNTSINFGYLGKLMWAIVMIAAFVSLSLMVDMVYSRYEDNPTRTYVKTRNAPIFFVPFPAVTVCSTTPQSSKIHEETLKKLRIPENMSYAEAVSLLKYGSEAAQPSLSSFNIIRRERLVDFLHVNNLKLVEFIKIITRPCAEFVESCYWEEKEINCSAVFKTSHTFRGFCCSYNYHLEDLIKTGRKDKANLYTTGLGPASGLTLVFKTDLFVGEDGTRKTAEKIITNSIGLVLFIHPNKDYLGNEHPAYILQAGMELQVRVQPKKTNRPVGFYRRSFLGHSLECLSENDRKLDFFPEYRYSNCYASCRMQASLQLCGCVHYFYNIMADNHSLPVCELKDFPCLSANSNEINIVTNVKRENFSCSCVDSCESLQYFVKPTWCSITEHRFIPSRIYRNLSDDHAVLRVFMDSQDFVVWETTPAADELYLLSSIGGIYGLFLGCSFLSIVEILYFALLFCRACTRKYKRS